MARVGCLCLTFALFILSLVLLILGKWWVGHDEAFVLGMFRAGSWIVLLGLAALLLSVIFAVVGFGRELREYGRSKKMVAQQEVRAASELARKLQMEADAATWDAGVKIVVAGGGDQVHALVRKDYQDMLTHWSLHLRPGDSERADERWRIWRATQHGRIPAGPGAMALPAAGLPDFASQVVGFERVLVAGPPESGKTSVLQHLAAMWEGELWVGDPHDNRRTWPSSARVVGGGQDYAAIESLAVEFALEIGRRYDIRHEQGDVVGVDPLMLLVDEWYEIWLNRPEVAEQWQVALTGGRKVKSGVALGSHSAQVGPLGLDGRGDLLKAFILVMTSGSKHMNDFKVVVNRNQAGPKQVQPPGPYGGSPAVPDLALPAGRPELPGVVWMPDDGVPMHAIGEEEQRVLEMYDRGEKITTIGRVVFGGGRSKGGEQNAMVKNVLRFHGRI